MLSVLRIGIAIGLFFNSYGTVLFTVMYLVGGLTDVADGFLARLLDASTKHGEILDSVADIFFGLVAFYRILPSLPFEKWMWIGIVVVFFLRVCNLLLSLIRRKKLLFLHTDWNKITGILVFLFPFAAKSIDLRAVFIPVFLVSLVASVEEGIRIWKGKTNDLEND